MSVFEFVFSLFGLLLGLSLAEILGGFARTVQARRAIRLGWLTPMLGLLLVIDLVSFWGNAWREREALSVAFNPMLYVTLLAGIYYIAASLVFPHDHDDWPDLDVYYMTHKTMVLGAVMGVNVLVIVGYVLLHGPGFIDWTFGLSWSAFVVTAIALNLRAGSAGKRGAAGVRDRDVLAAGAGDGVVPVMRKPCMVSSPISSLSTG